MSVTTLERNALLDFDNDELKALVSNIGIPPRPSVLVDMQEELRSAEPRMSRLADIAGSDVALSAALLCAANSPIMGLSRRAETVEQAFMLLGFTQCMAIFTELVLRKMLPTTGPVMTRFWDVSAKRARAMTYLARTQRLVPSALAHTYGLFVDVGIPIMARRFIGDNGYLQTLVRANTSKQSFTAIEQAAHGTDHTLIGAVAARTWCVSQTAVLAVRLHHDYAAWTRPLPPQVPELLALGLISEFIIQRYQGLNQHREWEKGGAAALQVLNLSETELERWCEEVHDQFDMAGI